MSTCCSLPLFFPYNFQTVVFFTAEVLLYRLCLIREMSRALSSEKKLYQGKLCSCYTKAHRKRCRIWNAHTTKVGCILIRIRNTLLIGDEKFILFPLSRRTNKIHFHIISAMAILYATKKYITIPYFVFSLKASENYFEMRPPLEMRYSSHI